MMWAFKSFSIEQSNPCIPFAKVDLFEGIRASDCSIEKYGIDRARFQLRKNARFGLRSEIIFFHSQIRLHKNWPNNPKQLILLI